MINRTLLFSASVRALVDPEADGVKDPIAVLTDRSGELDELFQAAAAGFEGEPVDQH